MEYNDRIRELREDNYLTQQKMADYLNVGQKTYSDYENGKIRVPIECLMRLAKYYDVSMDYISCASDIKGEFPKDLDKSV